MTGSGRVRRLALALGLVALVILVVALGLRTLRDRGARQNAFPLSEGNVAISGIEFEVVVYRDPRGVPHVEARSRRDALAALGYVHAQDRLGQMLWLRQQARGRTAEVLGRAGLAADRMARTVGFARLAQAQLPRLARETRSALEAYTAGVNARIEQIRSEAAAPPVWSQRLGLALDPWQPADSLAVFKLYAWGLGASVEESLVLAEMIQRLGPGSAGRFFPGGGLRDMLPEPDASVRRGMPAQDRAAQVSPSGSSPSASGLRRGLGMRGLPIGSSAWVLGGAHTQSGWPMVAADHHLPVSVPAWLHVDHVRGGDLDVAGSTLPGVPVFWSGHNQRVAWGAVAAAAVVTDLYQETLDPEHPDRFHDGRRWRDLDVRIEKILVRGAEPVLLRIRGAFHGPLLPPGLAPTALSVAWTGARIDGASGIGSLLGVASAQDARELLSALESHHEPVLAFVYADDDGAAGMQVAGWIPRRSLTAQIQPLPGRARYYHWDEAVSFDALPSARLLDGEGWIVAADASLAPRARAPIDWLWHDGARSARIESLLRDTVRGGPVDLRSMVDLQNDVGSTRSRRLVGSIETLLAASDEPLGPQAAEFARILTQWDGISSAGSRGAAAYHMLLDPLAAALLVEPVGEDLWQRYLALPRTNGESLLIELLADAALEAAAGGELAKRVGSEVRKSLREAWLRLSFELGPSRERWTWGRLHPIRFRPFAGLDAVLPDPAVGPYPYPGTRSTVLAGAYDPLEPFDVRVASTVRFAFDTGSLDQSLAILAPGQSEHPGHRHFDDQLGPWLEGRSALLATGALLVEETSVSRLRLEPVR